jgi:hypothetical protein
VRHLALRPRRSLGFGRSRMLARDLIDAEMAADHALPQSRPEVIAGLKQLTLWRGELQHLIRRLKSLEGGSGDPPLARRNMDDPNTTLREMAACP